VNLDADIPGANTVLRGPVGGSVTNIFTSSRRNLGDRYSSPLSYFDFPFPIETKDFNAIKRDFGSVILGGGGLFWHEERIKSIIDRTRGALVSWGVGHNSEGKKSLRWPAFMSRFTLHGVRDWAAGFNWVPCASCMHPVFDIEYRITREVVHYEHRRRRTGLKDLPMLRNIEPRFEDVIGFLGSASVILTNSYHGAYWGALLGRTVVIVQPFASRFFHMRHQPAIANNDDWKGALPLARSFPEALVECRAANREHFERVRELLSGTR